MISACEKQLVSALTVLTVLKKNGHRRCFVILVPKGIVSIGSRDIPNTHTHTLLHTDTETLTHTNSKRSHSVIQKADRSFLKPAQGVCPSILLPRGNRNQGWNRLGRMPRVLRLTALPMSRQPRGSGRRWHCGVVMATRLLLPQGVLCACLGMDRGGEGCGDSGETNR